MTRRVDGSRDRALPASDLRSQRPSQALKGTSGSIVLCAGARVKRQVVRSGRAITSGSRMREMGAGEGKDDIFRFWRPHLGGEIRLTNERIALVLGGLWIQRGRRHLFWLRLRCFCLGPMGWSKGLPDCPPLPCMREGGVVARVAGGRQNCP